MNSPQTSGQPVPAGKTTHDLNKGVFWPSLIVIGVIVVLLLIFPKQGNLIINTTLHWIEYNLDWFFEFGNFGFLLFGLYMVFGKYGKVKLGDSLSKPEFSTLSWAAMMFCTGIGSSLIYWGVCEPLSYWSWPPFGLEPYSLEAADWGVPYVMFHWGIMGWVPSIIPGLAVGFAYHNRKNGSLAISQACVPLIGKANADGLLGKIIDILVIFGIMGAAATSLGVGVPQLTEAISQLFHIPINQTVHEGKVGENLLHLISAAGIVIDGSCKGLGRCGCCRVQIIGGDAGEPDAAERKMFSAKELAEGWRLACRITVNDHLRVLLPQLANADQRKKNLLFIPDDFQDDGRCGGLGAAFDIGTTTVVAMVWQMDNGRLVDIEAATNPQSVYGADVISRINFCGEKRENLYIMQSKVVDCCNDMLKMMAERSRFSLTEVREAVVVGNTTMSHLFLAASPQTLAESPFTPAFYGCQRRLARELGLCIYPDAEITVLPNIAGHVGSDIVAGLLTSRLLWRQSLNLFIDMGTNGELVLADGQEAWACSTAAGPAFEGAAIYHGMRAAEGAIEGVALEQDDIVLQVIGGGKPRGICGSGLIDGMAALITSGLVEKNGRLALPSAAAAKGIPETLIKRLETRNQMPVFVLWQGENGQEVVTTQKDIREVQLGKGAIASGIQILLERAGKKLSDLDKLYVAGAFGNYIKKESAVAIGLLPPVPLEHIVSLGNSAGAGAAMALLSRMERERIMQEIATIQHVELAQTEGFQDKFMGAMAF